MIAPIFRAAALNLRRDRAALALSFLVPVVFFSIFAAIFGGSSERATTLKVRLLVVDEDRSERSLQLVEALGAESALDLRRAPKIEPGSVAPLPYDRSSAEAAVRAGDAPLALVVPAGFGAARIGFGPGAEHGARAKLELLADRSDPIAPQLVAGLLQKVAFTGLPDLLMPGGSGGDKALIEISTRDLLGETKKNPMVAFYAAGLGVMFLMFTAAGAGGALIEERESGTLDRVLSTRVSMTGLLAGKLLYLSVLGVTQLVVMFAWGWAVFGLDLGGKLLGSLLMAVPTAVAASSFGLVLAALAKSRKQLVALSNLVILSLSALGGSMFPRFLMPEAIQSLGLVAFNSWALEGFLDVLWRDLGPSALLPEIAVLLGWSVLFFLLARRLARRWEIA